MQPSKSTMLRCRNCGLIFQRPSRQGRAPQYCTRNCRTAAARRAKQHTAGPVSGEHDALVPLTSENVLKQLKRVRRTARDWRDGKVSDVAVLEQAVALQGEVDDLIAAAVLQARGRGVSWKQIAALTGVGPNRAPEMWSAERVRRMLARRYDARKAAQARAARERRTTGVGRLAPQPDSDPTTASRPEEQLRMALSYLQRNSGLSIRALAARLGVSPSLVARLLAGERMAGWPVIADLVAACGGNPAEVRPLWDEVHHRRPAPPVFQQEGAVAHAMAELTDAIRGLYLAGACPDPDRLAARHPGLTGEQVLGLVTREPGRQVPEWPVVEHLVGALRGRPENVLPLWQRAMVAQMPHWNPTARLPR